MGQSSKVVQQTEAIIRALSSMEYGAAIDDIKAAVGIEIELRTLQRRLADLKKSGFVRTYGEKRATRYYYDLPHVAAEPAFEFANPFNDNSLVPLSKEGQEIRSLVLLPLVRRKPVGYNQAFLESYRPNVDSYLTTAEKQQLAALGVTAAGADQPAGTFIKEILNRLLIDLSWNSSRLEGNTYSLLDTERLIMQGQVSGSKSVLEAQMILNHKDAIEFIARGASDIGFNRYTIQNLHALLAYNLLRVTATGRLRTVAVGIGQSVYTPLAIPQLVEAMFDKILEKAAQIENPFEQSFFVMVHIPYLQPFDDVNKRVSRLAANLPLSRHNLSPLSFTDVPGDLYTQGMLGVYELNRVGLLKDIFLWAYERSSQRYAAVRQLLGEPDPFLVRYRERVRALVTEIVSAALGREMTITLISDRSLQLPLNDRARFIEAVETELMSLHDGNFARFWVTPAEYRKWREGWDIIM